MGAALQVIFGLIIFIAIILVGIYYLARWLWDKVTDPLDAIVKDSYNRTAGVPMVCPSGKVNEGGLCYDKPKDGYSCTATLCSKDCLSGWANNGLFCGKSSYGRGAGTVLECPPGKVYDNGLCYPPPKDGYSCVATVCTKDCPSDYRDDGLYCAKPDSYGRGVGRSPDYETCKDGYTTYPLTCTKCSTIDNGYYNYSWGCGTSVVPCWDGSHGCKSNCYRTWISKLETECDTYNRKPKCKDNEDLYGDTLCYPKCKAGFKATGCCICSPECPTSEYTDIGVSCEKPRYDRGVGTTPDSCGSGKEKNGLLCYPNCKKGFEGNGPVCWQGPCDKGYDDIGISCKKPTYDRGVGKVPDTCPQGTDKDGALCYPTCKTGYVGKGPICWEEMSNPNGEPYYNVSIEL